MIPAERLSIIVRSLNPDRRSTSARSRRAGQRQPCGFKPELGARSGRRSGRSTAAGVITPASTAGPTFHSRNLVERRAARFHTRERRFTAMINLSQRGARGLRRRATPDPASIRLARGDRRGIPYQYPPINIVQISRATSWTAGLSGNAPGMI